MTFLDGVTRFCSECGVNFNGLTTVVGQTGQLKRMVDWYASAWFDIQELHEQWKFMRRSTTWPLVAGTGSYTPADATIPTDTFRKWIADNGRTYFTAVGLSSEQFLTNRDYDSFRNMWLLGANRTVQSRPYEFAIAPDSSLVFGPLPISGLQASMDYYKRPVLLALDADVPALPDGHTDMIVVYKAMMFYGGFYAAQEAYQRGQLEYTKHLRKLVNTQLPQPSMVGAFA